MRINDNSRPKEITSNEIWELYKLFEGLDEHYVFYDRCDAPKNREELFYLAGTRLGDDGMIYEAPGGFTEGCIWFFDKVAETRVYYNQMGADICKRSEGRQDLLRLLNFINARVFMELNDGVTGGMIPRYFIHREFILRRTTDMIYLLRLC